MFVSLCVCCFFPPPLPLLLASACALLCVSRTSHQLPRGVHTLSVFAAGRFLGQDTCARVRPCCCCCWCSPPTTVLSAAARCPRRDDTDPAPLLTCEAMIRDSSGQLTWTVRAAAAAAAAVVVVVLALLCWCLSSGFSLGAAFTPLCRVPSWCASRLRWSVLCRSLSVCMCVCVLCKRT